MKKILFAAAIFMLSAMNVMAQDKVFVDDFTVKAGEQVDITLNLTNPEKSYSAVQCELFLPEGLEIATEIYDVEPEMMIELNNNKKTGRLRDHTCSPAKASNGSYRFVIMSMTSAEIRNNEGPLMTITLQASENFAGGTGRVDAIVLVDADGKKFEIEPSTFQVTAEGTDGIKDIKADATSDSPIYDLQGRRVEKTTKGLYIVNGNKVVMK